MIPFEPCNKDAKDARVEMEIFDDDGPEGYFTRLYFRSSWAAVNYAVRKFNSDYHFRITQRTP